MKKFAIVVDEKNEKRVVPSNWLHDDLNALYWPSDESIDIKKAIINRDEPDSNWDEYPIKKLIKFNGNYLIYKIRID